MQQFISTMTTIHQRASPISGFKTSIRGNVRKRVMFFKKTKKACKHRFLSRESVEMQSSERQLEKPLEIVFELWINVTPQGCRTSCPRFGVTMKSLGNRWPVRCVTPVITSLMWHCEEAFPPAPIVTTSPPLITKKQTLLKVQSRAIKTCIFIKFITILNCVPPPLVNKVCDTFCTSLCLCAAIKSCGCVVSAS